MKDLSKPTPAAAGATSTSEPLHKGAAPAEQPVNWKRTPECNADASPKEPPKPVPDTSWGVAGRTGSAGPLGASCPLPPGGQSTPGARSKPHSSGNPGGLTDRSGPQT